MENYHYFWDKCYEIKRIKILSIIVLKCWIQSSFAMFAIEARETCSRSNPFFPLLNFEINIFNELCGVACTNVRS